jgi:hypothetical protein
MAEMFDGRQLGERTFRPEIGNGQRTFQRQALRHHLAKQPGDRFGRQRPRIERTNAAQHLRLALRAINHAAAFDFADGTGVRRTLIEQRENLLVDAVDGIAMLFQ